MNYRIETLRPYGGWTSDVSLLGAGCTDADNTWPSEAEALAAADELAADLRISRSKLRVRPLGVDAEPWPPAETVPTVNEILAETAVGGGWHDFAMEGGTVRVDRLTLREALEEAYDPSMSAWPSLVELDKPRFLLATDLDTGEERLYKISSITAFAELNPTDEHPCRTEIQMGEKSYLVREKASDLHLECRRALQKFDD